MPADDPLAVLVAELREVKGRGIATIVDVSSEGTAPRDLDLLRRASEASWVHVILGTGFYKEPLLPGFVYEADVEAIAEHMVYEITRGVSPDRVVIGHSDLSPDPGYVEAVLRTGANVGIDTIGKQRFHYVRPESRGQGPYEALLESYFSPTAGAPGWSST